MPTSSLRRQVQSLRCFLRGASLMCEILPRSHRHPLPSNHRAMAQDWKAVGSDLMHVFQSYGDQRGSR